MRDSTMKAASGWDRVENGQAQQEHVELWDAINEVVAASGGSTSCTNVARQHAVVRVHQAVTAIVAASLVRATKAAPRGDICMVRVPEPEGGMEECSQTLPCPHHGIRSDTEIERARRGYRFRLPEQNEDRCYTCRHATVRESGSATCHRLDIEVACARKSQCELWSAKFTGPADEAAGATLDALVGLLGWAERNSCQHEEAHRGGVLWTICDSCGKMWADDRGGFVPWQAPPEFVAAEKAIAAERARKPQLDERDKEVAELREKLRQVERANETKADSVDHWRQRAEKAEGALAAFVAEVRSMTAEFVGWTECDADLIEGQEDEVAVDHNRMLGRLRELHQRAEADR